MTIIDSTNTDATDPPKSDAQQVASNASTADPNKSKHSLTNENEDTSNSTPESDSLANSKQTQISNSTQSSSSSPLQYIGESDPVTPLETSDAFPGSLSSPQPTGDSETGSKAISDSSLSTENLTPQSFDSPQSPSASSSVETLAKSKDPVFTSPQLTSDSETGPKAASDSSLSTENLTPQSLDLPQSCSASPSIETSTKSKDSVFTSPQPTPGSETGSKATSDSSLSTENLTPQSLDSPQSSSASPSVETLAKSKGPVFTEMAADASSSALVSNPTSKDPVSPPPGSNDPVTAVKPTTKQPSLFHIKRISIGVETLPILHQNENGPCPLLAIANYLFLTLQERVNGDISMVREDWLLQMITNRLLNRAQNSQSQLINDILISVLPQINHGLDINVKFGGVSKYEYTPQQDIFDILGIELHHAWVIDPQEKQIMDLIGHMSYNQITTMLVTSESDASEQDSISKDRLSAKTKKFFTPSEKRLVTRWLSDHSGQITIYGLSELYRLLKPNVPVVLFRNNHFSIIVKFKKLLYTLVTDIGFLGHPNLVWESFNDIKGDSEFLDGNFQIFKPRSIDLASRTQTKSISADHELALRLQREEQARYRANSRAQEARNNRNKRNLHANRRHDGASRQAYSDPSSVAMTPQQLAYQKHALEFYKRKALQKAHEPPARSQPRAQPAQPRAQPHTQPHAQLHAQPHTQPHAQPHTQPHAQPRVHEPPVVSPPAGVPAGQSHPAARQRTPDGQPIRLRQNPNGQRQPEQRSSRACTIF